MSGWVYGGRGIATCRCFGCCGNFGFLLCPTGSGYRSLSVALLYSFFQNCLGVTYRVEIPLCTGLIMDLGPYGLYNSLFDRTKVFVSACILFKRFRLLCEWCPRKLSPFATVGSVVGSDCCWSAKLTLFRSRIGAGMEESDIEIGHRGGFSAIAGVSGVGVCSSSSINICSQLLV